MPPAVGGAREDEEFPDEVEERLINEEYKIWKKNAPFLYGGWAWHVQHTPLDSGAPSARAGFTFVTKPRVRRWAVRMRRPSGGVRIQPPWLRSDGNLVSQLHPA